MGCANRCIVFFSAFVIGIIGIGMLALSIFMMVNNQDFWSALEEEGNNQYFYVSIAILILAIILTLSGICGVIAACKKNRCLVFIFQFGNLILCGAFMVLAVMSTIFYGDFLGAVEDNSTCLSEDQQVLWMNNAELAFSATGTIFCQDKCPCYMPTALQEEAEEKYSPLPTNIQNNPNDGFVRSQDCNDGNPEELFTVPAVAEQYEIFAPMGRFLELTFECSGMCTPLPFYTFSDSSEKLPENNVYTGKDPFTGVGCYQKMYDFLNDSKLYILLAIWLLTVFLILIFVVSCTLCCKNKKDNGYGKEVYFGMEED